MRVVPGPFFLSPATTSDKGGLQSHHSPRRGHRQYSVLVDCLLLNQLLSLFWVFLSKFCVFEVQMVPWLPGATFPPSGAWAPFPLSPTAALIGREGAVLSLLAHLPHGLALFKTRFLPWLFLVTCELGLLPQTLGASASWVLQTQYFHNT